ncbi:hypothetical protein DFJ58DRAFT_623165, partial [Suillus subalutaceus]|uniref:uncharacterized protein n=1 Tax=Suillus subalutaceus TaxID=48586 RepID=UPI001B878CE8
NRITTKCPNAWSMTGVCAHRRDYFIRVCLFRYSILPAISLDGVLHLDIQDHSYTAATFNEFIEGLLDNMNQYPQKNSVIVMDNA